MKVYIFATIALLTVVATTADDISERRLVSADCDNSVLRDFDGNTWCCCESSDDDCEKSDWKWLDGKETCEACEKLCDPEYCMHDCKGMEGKSWVYE